MLIADNFESTPHNNTEAFLTFSTLLPTGLLLKFPHFHTLCDYFIENSIAKTSKKGMKKKRQNEN